MPSLEGSNAKAICVYILRTVGERTLRTYVGYSVCLKERLKAHAGLKGAGVGAKSTRDRTWEPYVAVTGFVSKTEAMSFEWHLKYQTKIRNKNAILAWSSVGTREVEQREEDSSRRRKKTNSSNASGSHSGKSSDSLTSSSGGSTTTRRMKKEESGTMWPQRKIWLSPCDRRVASLWRLLADKDRSWNQRLDPIPKLERGLEHGHHQEKEDKDDEHVDGAGSEDNDDGEVLGARRLKRKQKSEPVIPDTPFIPMSATFGAIDDNNDNNSSSKHVGGLNLHEVQHNVAQDSQPVRVPHPPPPLMAQTTQQQQQQPQQPANTSQAVAQNHRRGNFLQQPILEFIQGEQYRDPRFKSDASSSHEESCKEPRHWIVHWSTQAQRDLPSCLVRDLLLEASPPAAGEPAELPFLLPSIRSKDGYWGVPDCTFVHHIPLSIDHMDRGLSQLPYLFDHSSSSTTSSPSTTSKPKQAASSSRRRKTSTTSTTTTAAATTPEPAPVKKTRSKRKTGENN